MRKDVETAVIWDQNRHKSWLESIKIMVYSTANESDIEESGEVVVFPEPLVF